MLDFKGQESKSVSSKGPAQAAQRKRRRFASFDFLNFLTECLSVWGTPRLELRPIPVRVRRRR